MSKTTLTCGRCKEGWICERHPDLPWPHDPLSHARDAATAGQPIT